MDAESIFCQVLKHFDDSPAKLARALNETTPVVCNWRARGIPANKAKAVEALTGISVRAIRPDDWNAYWPEPARMTRRKAAKATA